MTVLTCFYLNYFLLLFKKYFLLFCLKNTFSLNVAVDIDREENSKDVDVPSGGSGLAG